MQAESEGSDGEDEAWYNRMEEEAMKTDTYEDMAQDLAASEGADHASGPVSEEAYFNSVQQFNTETNGDSFIGESDPLWYHMMKDAARSTMQAAASTASTGMLVQLRREDVSSLILCRNWAFGFLPHSCKMYLELCHCSEGNFWDQRLFTDNIVHPSIVASFLVKEEEGRVEVSLYSPYKAHEVAFPAFFKTLEYIRATAKVPQVMFAAISCDLYETAVRVNPRWEQEWVNECGVFVNEDVFSTAQTHSRDGIMENLPDYALCELRDEDAHAINDTWKFKTASSLQMTKTMIASKLCIGIYRRTQEDGSHKRKRQAGSREWEEGEGAQGDLVSWVMIYKYGALGMLYTQPEHRGKGLAKAAVRALLLLLRESPTDMRCPPFCYIERSNDASRALFTSLGFLRIDDVQWAGMRFKDVY